MGIMDTTKMQKRLSLFRTAGIVITDEDSDRSANYAQEEEEEKEKRLHRDESSTDDRYCVLFCRVNKEKSENEKRRNKTLAQVKSLARRFISGLSLSSMLGEKGEPVICSTVPPNILSIEYICTVSLSAYSQILADTSISNPTICWSRASMEGTGK
jgi:hypothetical protein